VRIAFDEPTDVCQILLPLRCATLLVEKRPQLALKNVFHGGDLQRDAEDFARRGARDERRVARIRLNLHAKLRASRADVHTVRKSLDSKTAGKKFFDAIEIFGGNGHIEIEADQRLGVGIHSVAVNDAVSNGVVGEQRQKVVEEISAIVRHGFPVCERPPESSYAARVTGSLSTMLVPTPSIEATVTSPPWASTTCFTM
jgi:hypothetical protein